MEERGKITTLQSIACGGTGGELTAVDAEDGKIVRIRPFRIDTAYTEEELAPAMWTLRSGDKEFKPEMKSAPNYFALAYKNRVYSKNRVSHPLIREDWKPGGNPETMNAANRGISKFKRISWEEALDIVAGEIRRIIDQYGAPSVLCIGEDGHRESKDLHSGGGMHATLMSKLGGYTREVRTPDSVEGWYWGAKHVWGSGATKGLGMVAPPQTGFESWNVMKDVTENAELIAFDAGDWENTQNYASQFWSRLLKFWEDAGKEFVVVDPFCNYTAACHESMKWIPILPNTDAAFDFGVMYVWLTEGLYDKEYVDTHTVGFDKVKAYILGEDEEGIAKTPAWASERCGVPTWTIKAYARNVAKKATSHACYSSGAIKGPYSHEPGRTGAYKLAMQGLGKPGVQQLYMNCSTVAKEKIASGSVNPFTSINQARMFFPNAYMLPRTLVAEALQTGKAKWWGSPAIVFVETEEQFQEFNYPLPADKGGAPIHMVWSEKPCNMNCWDGGFRFQDAIRSDQVEFFLTNHQWLENDSLFADMVLPVTTCLEDNDAKGASMCVAMRHAGLTVPACDRVGESYSDFEIMLMLADKFGVRDQIDMGMTEDEWIKYSYDRSKLSEEISWEEYNEKKYYFPHLEEDWEDYKPGMRGFYEDPESWPLDTPSGKLELWSEALATNFPDDKERTPMARWITGGPASEGWSHDESLWGERCKEYPLLIVANPARFRVHVQGDDIMWYREIKNCKVRCKDGYMYEPLWISPKDAADRGIQEGDLLKVFNDRGTVLVGAHISERINDGSVMVHKGSRVDPIAPHLDRGGAINLISPTNQVSQHCKGFAVTGYLVQVAKVDDAEYEGWKAQYPEAFARDYDPGIGINYKSWVTE